MPERSKLSDLSSRFHLLHLLVAHCCNCEWQLMGESLESFSNDCSKTKAKSYHSCQAKQTQTILC